MFAHTLVTKKYMVICFIAELPCTFLYNSCSVARISLNRYRAGAWRGERGGGRRPLP